MTAWLWLPLAPLVGAFTIAAIAPALAPKAPRATPPMRNAELDAQIAEGLRDWGKGGVA